MAKYKLTWKDLTWKDFKIYLFSLFKAFIPKTKISNLDDLEDFIQSKSAWVTQVTLYGYLKTRMGTRYVLHFENDKFMASVNLAKWNMYAVALQDLTFFTFSFLSLSATYVSNAVIIIPPLHQLQGNGLFETGCNFPSSYRENLKGSRISDLFPITSSDTKSPTPAILYP